MPLQSFEQENKEKNNAKKVPNLKQLTMADVVLEELKLMMR